MCTGTIWPRQRHKHDEHVLHRSAPHGARSAGAFGAQHPTLSCHVSRAIAVLWRTEGESGVEGECAKYRDTARKEAQGYSLYGVNAPACKPGPDGKPAEQQPDWPSEWAGSWAWVEMQ